MQRLWLVCVLIGGATAGMLSSVKAECEPQDATATGEAEIAAATCGPKAESGKAAHPPTSQAATMQVFTDPRTGEVIPPPMGGAGQTTQEPLPMSTGDFAENPSPVVGGGEVIHLKGRFNRPVASQGVETKNPPPRAVPQPEVGGKR